MSTRILVVDDEPDVETMFRQHFRRELRSGRFIMEFALSAPAALAYVKATADPSLILILSDINMPGMSGLEMLPKMRAERPNVPVIMITAYGDEATKRYAIAQGAVGLLTKPIDLPCCAKRSMRGLIMRHESRNGSLRHADRARGMPSRPSADYDLGTSA